MDLFDACRARYSYRGDFRDEPVPQEDLQKIVETGIAAPSGCNAQSTTFVIVDDPALLKEMAVILDKEYLKTAPAYIVCISDPAPVYRELSFEKEDCAAAVENMLLAIAALGYATVWIDGYLRNNEIAARLNALLKIPVGLTVQVVLPVGRPVETGSQAPKKPFAERAAFNCYPGGTE